MNENKPLLSICIPTYNRAEYLKECLKIMAPYTTRENIEIIISDNHSSDTTATVVADFKAKYSRIKCYVQKENIGPDKNFEFVLRQATGKYAWLMGDSTFVNHQNLEHVLFYLRENNFDYVVVGGGRTENISENVYTDANLLLSELGWHMTWMSCLIYNTNKISNLKFSRYYESNFIQTGIIFEDIANTTFTLSFLPNVNISSVGISKDGIKPHSWVPQAFEVFCKRWYLFIYSLPLSYSFETKKKCVMDHGHKSKLFALKNLLFLRSQGYYSIQVLLKYKFFISQCIKKTFFSLILISIIPKKLLSAIRIVYKKRRGA